MYTRTIITVHENEGWLEAVVGFL